MLHTVNKSPFEKGSLDSCLRLATKGSAILLIEDGVYGAMKGTALEGKLEEAVARFKVYALGPDLRARGLDDHQARLLAHLARGRVGWAIEASQDERMLERRDQLLDELRGLAEGGYVQRLAWAEQLL